MTNPNPMTEKELVAMYERGERCRADRDGDCNCECRYRIAGNNHCYLDVLAMEREEDYYGS